MINLIPKTFFIAILLILLSFQYSTSLEQKNQLEPNQAQKVIQSLKTLPLYFVENKGQVNECVKYHLKILNANVYFSPDEIVYQFLHREDEWYIPKDRLMREEKQSGENIKVENIRLTFVGASESAKVEGLEESEAKVSYFKGNNPLKWVKGARTYKKVLYKGLYPHIDLIVHGGGKKIKHEYRVKGGGDVDDIVIKYDGIEQLRVNERGQLEIETEEGILKEDAPFCYQIVDGHRVEVKAEYKVDRDNTIRFKMDNYRKDKELIIDPTLIYSTYLGGSGSDYGNGIAVDVSGNAYIVGRTWSSDFPTKMRTYDLSRVGGFSDGFIAKLNASGTGLLYSIYLGGNDEDQCLEVAVDGSGNAYVTGETYSSDFPTTQGAYDTALEGWTDAFITKVNSTGTDLIYSTFLGGNNLEKGEGIAVDGSGNAYVTGETNSWTLPTTPGAYDTSHNGSNDTFITKLNSTGTGLVYSTFLGGDDWDKGAGIAVDGSGNAYVAGNTESSNFPTTPGAYDTSFNGGGYYWGTDVVITKINSSGTDLIYSTYLGGSDDDYSFGGIVIDGGGSVYITGDT